MKKYDEYSLTDLAEAWFDSTDVEFEVVQIEDDGNVVPRADLSYEGLLKNLPLSIDFDASSILLSDCLSALYNAQTDVWHIKYLTK